MNPSLIAFIGHLDRCDWLQPMWHKGPCDCGLHAVLDALSAEDLVALEAARPNIVAGWRSTKENRK